MTTPQWPCTRELLTLARTVGPPADVTTAPESVLTSPDLVTPYYVLHPLFAEITGETLMDLSADATFHYDLWSIGETHEQAAKALDMLVAVITGVEDREYVVPWPDSPAPPEPQGREPQERNLMGYGPGGTVQDRKIAWVTAEVAVAILT